ncbi:MAG: hypothetical protein KDD42_00265, partial [Bdellovibrionales bacterium]|nr:hypothetical protein [Bdellovibrionales bacterium]
MHFHVVSRKIIPLLGITMFLGAGALLPSVACAKPRLRISARALDPNIVRLKVRVRVSRRAHARQIRKLSLAIQRHHQEGGFLTMAEYRRVRPVQRFRDAVNGAGVYNYRGILADRSGRTVSVSSTSAIVQSNLEPVLPVDSSPQDPLAPSYERFAVPNGVLECSQQHLDAALQRLNAIRFEYRTASLQS